MDFFGIGYSGGFHPLPYLRISRYLYFSFENAQSTFEFIAPIMELVIGISLAFIIIKFILNLFKQTSKLPTEEKETIEIKGKKLTFEDINNNEKMPMEWYRGLSSDEQKLIADFDHTQARKKMKM